MTDETNTTANEGKFFIYGGLVVTDSQATELHHAIAGIRKAHGYEPGDSFKFQTASRPKDRVSPESFLAAKAATFEAMERIGVRMIVNVTHHAIAESQGLPKTTMWAINTVLAAYFRLLAAERAHGVVSIDRVDGKYGYAHLQTSFQHGLTFPDGRTLDLSGRIIYFGMTPNNASHLSSAVDIALGGLRYCVNTSHGKGNDTTAKAIFPTVARLLWAHEVAGVRHIGGYGYLQRPLSIRIPTYAAEYAQLRESLALYASANADEVSGANDIQA